MMSDDELQRLRERKLAELQQQQYQAQQADAAAQQNAMFEEQKQTLLARILSSEARSRLGNIRLARPEFADMIEMQLIQAYQTGALRNQIPLSDETFKQLLVQLQNNSRKKESKIKFM